MEFVKEFALAKKVVQEAGEILIPYYNQNIPYSLKAHNSLLTEADLASERFIKDTLRKEYPLYGFIGEETDLIDKKISWILDPLDGTRPFVRHIPEFGIALSLKIDNDVALAVLYLPLSKTLLTAYKGHGAYENDKKLAVSTLSNLDVILVSLGMQNFWENEYKKQTAILLNRIQNQFRAGLSSVQESYYLASGKIDVYMRYDQPIWDIAAQYLLMKEAGAVVTDQFGRPLALMFSKSAKHTCIATNPALAKKAKQFLYGKI